VEGDKHRGRRWRKRKKSQYFRKTKRLTLASGGGNKKKKKKKGKTKESRRTPRNKAGSGTNLTVSKRKLH